MAVAGFRDGPQGPGLSGRMLRRDQAEVSADCGAGEPVPVADLHGQSKCGQRRDTAQALQCPDHGGVFTAVGHRSDRLIEAATSVRDLLHRLKGGLIGQLPGRCVEPLPGQPELMGSGPGLPARINDALPQQEFGDPVPAFTM